MGVAGPEHLRYVGLLQQFFIQEVNVIRLVEIPINDYQITDAIGCTWVKKRVERMAKRLFLGAEH